MRRKEREKDYAYALRIIDASTHATVSMVDEGIPYAVPLSIVRQENVLYFHCGPVGRKVDILSKNPNVFVTFIGADDICKDDFSTNFLSAMVKGKAFQVTQEDEKIRILRLISEKFVPNLMLEFDDAIKRSLHRTCVWGIEMQEVTAKGKGAHALDKTNEKTSG